MDELSELGSHLGAALRGGGSEAERLLLLQSATNLLAFVAALLIPLGIVYFAAHRRDFEFRGLLWLFAIAFGAAAVGHSLGIWGLLHPDPWMLGSAQLVAALLSFGAGLALWMHLPDAVRLPSPRQLRRTNAKLTRETWEQQRAVQKALEEALLLRNSLEHASIGMALISPGGGWLQMNEAFAQAHGAKRIDLVKKEPRTVLSASLLSAESATEERKVETGDDTRRFRMSISTMHDAAGNTRARLVQCLEIRDGTAEATLAQMHEDFVAQQAKHRSENDEATARLDQALAEKEKIEEELSAHAERLERNTVQLEYLGARLSDLAGFDSGTGLLSPYALAGRLDLALAYAKRFGQGFGILVIAADATHDGNADPSASVSGLGAVLRAELRETDAAARCDEERICVLLPASGKGGATQVADRIRKRLAATPLAVEGGGTLQLTCRVGSAEWQPGQSLSEVLGQASEALRVTRSDGRNRVSQ